MKNMNQEQLQNEHLDWLEAESIYIIREVAAQCSNPAMLFSGGKDSIVMFHLARKAFRFGDRPIHLPFPLLHIDTGHNYPEVIQFRDDIVAKTGSKLIVGHVEDSIRKGTVRLRKETDSRNAAQANWTELDIWQYIAREKLDLPSIYYAHQREVVRKNGLLVPVTNVTPKAADEVSETISVRFRTVGDISCTCPVLSVAATAEDIIKETAISEITERGATRMDDQTSEASMERRKKEGYF